MRALESCGYSSVVGWPPSLVLLRLQLKLVATGSQHSMHSLKKKKSEDFVKKDGTCFTQLSRPPYFDLVCGIVIDPMHNLILGGAATPMVHPCMLMIPLHD